MMAATRVKQARTGRCARLTLSLAALAAVLSVWLPQPAQAHGERTQQPSLRMRTVQWYDMQWSPVGPLEVGDMVTVTGKMFLPGEQFWPASMNEPDPSYLQTSGPSAVFIQREAYINEVPMVRSADLELGSTYDFKLVLQARIPGKWHIHPALHVHGEGAIVGPGSFSPVSGEWGDYVWPTRAGRGGRIEIENLETWQLGNVIGWHGFWVAAALGWLLWWIRRPTLLPRYRALREGHEDLLLTRADPIAGVVLLLGTVIMVGGTYAYARVKYPETIPLQTGKTPVLALEESVPPVTAIPLDAEFDVPGRALRMTLRVTNDGDEPLWLSEYATAGLRFLNSSNVLPDAAEEAVQASLQGYPDEYVKRSLKVSPAAPIPPGETREIRVEAADAVWEIEGLAEVVESPVRRFGGLLWLHDAAGERYRQYVDFAVKVSYGGEL